MGFYQKWRRLKACANIWSGYVSVDTYYYQLHPDCLVDIRNGILIFLKISMGRWCTFSMEITRRRNITGFCCVRIMYKRSKVLLMRRLVKNFFHFIHRPSSIKISLHIQLDKLLSQETS